MQVQKLVQLDEDLRKIMLSSGADKIRDFIKGLLEEASKTPGRHTKLRVTYILERMSEISQDLCEDDAEFYKRYADISKWIDRGLQYTAYLVDPESKGKFLAQFDQTVIQAKVPDPKDPKAAKEREERAGLILDRWNQKVAQMRQNSDRPAGGGNLIIPGSSY
jgi:hypothetical protein